MSGKEESDSASAPEEEDLYRDDQDPVETPAIVMASQQAPLPSASLSPRDSDHSDKEKEKEEGKGKSTYGVHDSSENSSKAVKAPPKKSPTQKAPLGKVPPGNKYDDASSIGSFFSDESDNEKEKEKAPQAVSNSTNMSSKQSAKSPPKKSPPQKASSRNKYEDASSIGSFFSHESDNEKEKKAPKAVPNSTMSDQNSTQSAKAPPKKTPPQKAPLGKAPPGNKYEDASSIGSFFSNSDYDYPVAKREDQEDNHPKDTDLYAADKESVETPAIVMAGQARPQVPRFDSKTDGSMAEAAPMSDPEYSMSEESSVSDSDADEPGKPVTIVTNGKSDPSKTQEQNQKSSSAPSSNAGQDNPGFEPGTEEQGTVKLIQSEVDGKSSAPKVDLQTTADPNTKDSKPNNEDSNPDNPDQATPPPPYDEAQTPPPQINMDYLQDDPPLSTSNLPIFIPAQPETNEPADEDIDDTEAEKKYTFEELYMMKKEEEQKKTFQSSSTQRRKDWLAFEDYDDSDSDAAEILTKIPGGDAGDGLPEEQHHLDFGYVCCPCSTWCVERRLNKVSPEQAENAEAALRRHLDVTRGMEVAPPEGRRLFFEDGLRRIDYVLVWRDDVKDPDKAAERLQCRKVFERNLEEEGLEIEYDIKMSRELQFVKIHAPWEVLCRYAEIMKLRMPIKEVPEEIATTSIWELLTDFTSKLMSPFELNPLQVPPMPKKFTHVFERNKHYLFDIPERKDLFFSHAQRSRIVDYILRRKKYSDEDKDTFAFGIKRLLASGVYTSAYPLHEGSWKPWTKPSMRRLLYDHWANWKNFYKLQPLDYIRVYFGEKIGLYFAWLGFYTYFLIAPSIVGLIVFIYGVWTINSDIVGQETCNPYEDYLMCPKCDLRCPYWNYSSVCRTVRASHMFDNGGTVFFAIFMSLWGALFLEFWKREQAGIQFKWNLMNFQEEEEPPRPEYLIKLQHSKFRKKHRVSGQEEPFVPFWRRRVPIMAVSFSVMLFLCAVALSVVVGVIVYRMAVLTALYARQETLVYKNATMITSATAACVNLVCIFILNFVYEYLAIILTDWECLRTQSEYDRSLTIKLYTLQFVNYYSSLIYIAFIKGRFTGRPGDYNTLFGARQEECQGGGCLIELCIQLAIIFVGKQLIQNNLMEIFIPRLKKCMKTTFACFGAQDMDEKDKASLMPWEKDFILEELGTRGIFNEYLEMLIQFGFVTIFVAAFPLAPLFALINNIIEIRADADKFVTQLRRPMAQRAQTIGVWYELLYALSRLSILTNAMIIAFTSSFIHRLVYTYEYSEDGSLAGYVNNSLAYFNVSDFAENNRPIDNEGKFNSVEICRYRAYRNPPWDEDKYAYTEQFWHVMAVQFLFVVIFENVVVLIVNAVAYLVPDMPRKLREQVRRENYLTNEIILKVELDIAKGQDSNLDEDEMETIRRRIQETIFAFGNAKKGGDKGADGGEDGKGGTDGAGGGFAALGEAGGVPSSNEPAVMIQDGARGAGGGGGGGVRERNNRLASGSHEEESNV